MKLSKFIILITTAPEEDDDDLDENEMLLYRAVKEKQIIARKKSHGTKSLVPRKFTIRGRSEDEVAEHLESHGLESEGVLESTRGRKRTRSVSSVRSSSNVKKTSSMDVEGEEDEGSRGPVRKASARDRSVSVQSRSRTRGPRSNSAAPQQLKQIKKLGKTEERKMIKYARAGTSDREHYPKLVKHLNSGKRSLGTSTIGR